jgi:nitroimidazol reductase NimA-like FMN-containing flavoprotein (pyridoxamine 5'-phosphate oxidase superfamily)
MDAQPFTALVPSECSTLLRANDLGRLALAVAGEVDIFPINYAVADDDTIVFRTAPGTKLAELVIRPSVAFEIDGVVDGRMYSVIVKGTAEWLSSTADIAAAEALGLKTLAPTWKANWVRITPTWVTGRIFTPGPEPEAPID